jgi:hypothetical protein
LEGKDLPLLNNKKSNFGNNNSGISPSSPWKKNILLIQSKMNL